MKHLISSFDIAAKLFKLLANAVTDVGGAEEDLRRLETDIGLREKVARLIVGQVSAALTVTVDYARSLAQMIRSGKYDWVNSDITEKNFPVTGTGKQEVVLELLHFNKMMSSDQVLVEMKNRKLRPATLPELLAFGEKYPDEQRKYPIVALGSVWRYWFGGRDVPCLWSDGGYRRLGLDWFGDDWLGFYRFLTVRES